MVVPSQSTRATARPGRVAGRAPSPSSRAADALAREIGGGSSSAPTSRQHSDPVFPAMLRSPVTLAVCVAVPAALIALSGRRYPVHSSGAIVVTGASSGIGKHAALALDTAGFTVYAGVRKESDATALKEERASLRPLIIDVTKQEQVDEASKRVKREIAEEGVPLVGLVNNAGISRRLPLELEDLDKVKQLYEVRAPRRRPPRLPRAAPPRAGLTAPPLLRCSRPARFLRPPTGERLRRVPRHPGLPGPSP